MCLPDGRRCVQNIGKLQPMRAKRRRLQKKKRQEGEKEDDGLQSLRIIEKQKPRNGSCGKFEKYPVPQRCTDVGMLLSADYVSLGALDKYLPFWEM